MPSATKQKPLVLRKLGTMEGHEAALYGMGLYNSTMVTCHYIVPESLVDLKHQGKLAQIWELAVARVVLAHPFMQLGLINVESKRPSYVQIETIDLTNHIEWRTVNRPEDYSAIRKQTMLEQLGKKFMSIETVPGWRITILRNLQEDSQNDLESIFAWNHPFFDGTSAKVFHEDLVKALNTVTDDMTNRDSDPKPESHIFKTNATRSNLFPTQDVAIDFSCSLPYTAALLWKELTPPKILFSLSHSAKSLANKCKGWPPMTQLNTKDKLTNPPKTRLATLSVDHGTLKRVLTACRAHTTTITGLLQVIVLISIAQQLPGSATGSILRSGTALNLRRYVSPSPNKDSPLHNPDRVMANVVTKMSHYFGHDDKELLSKIRKLNPPNDEGGQTELDEILWSTAARVRSELQHRLDLGPKNEVAGLMRFVTDWRDYFKNLLKKPRESSWNVTNIGVLDGGLPTSATTSADTGGNEGSKWHIRKAYFTLSVKVPGPGIAVSCVTVKGGEMCVDLTWEEGVVEDEIGERVAVDIERWLRRIGTSVLEWVVITE